MQRPDTPDGLFHDGDPTTGVKGTPITAEWLNALIAVGAFLSGDTEPPAAELGGAGDFYLCKTSHKMYGPKDQETGWPAGYTSIIGPQGVEGFGWLSGSGAPNDANGRDGDYYLRTDTYDIHKKAAGAWGAAIINIKGLTGNPYKAYATLAAANADLANIPADALVWINADGTSTNNGFWSKTGGVLVQSSYDRVAITERTAAMLQGGQLAESVPNKLPDLWRDGPFFRTSASAAKELRSGHETLHIYGTNGYRTIQIPAANFASGKFDGSIVIVEKTAVAGVTFLIRQNASNGSEVAGTRVTATIPSTAISSPTLYEFKNVVIDAACVNIEFWMGVGNTGAEAWFALPLLAESTGWTGYRPQAVRPRVTSLEARVTPLEADFSSLKKESYLPNLISDPFFENLDQWAGTGTIVREDLNAIPTAKVTVAYKYFSIARSAIPASTLAYYVKVAQHATNAVSRTLIRQMNGASEIVGARRETQIAAAQAGPIEIKMENIVVDPACTEIQVWLDSQSATSCHFQLPSLIAEATISGFRPPAFQIKGSTGSSTLKTIYVATDGSDANTGTSSAPVATFAKAITLLGGNGNVVVRGGDYTQTIPLASAERLKVWTYPQERVRLMLGTAITNVVKEAGYTKVYSGDLVTAPNKHIFEHGTPEGLISAAERHSLQRGRSHRLPSTRLWPVASIAEVDSDPRPTWYHNGAGKIYFSASDGGDATTHTYYSQGALSGCSGGTAKADVEIQGIEAWYGDYGFSFANCGNYRAVDLFVIGSRGDGIVGDKSCGTEIRCESCANGNDGFNSHHQTTTPEATTRNGVYLRIDPWAHDNYDDGSSVHERCQETVLGGLLEYNGDRGIVPAGGAHTTIRGAYSRFNGQLYGDAGVQGQNYGIINSAVAGEGGVGTQMECYDCISEGGCYGFGSHAADGIIRAINCRTKDATIAAYSADYGKLYAYDCKDSGSAEVKSATNGGEIVVSNGVAVT